MRTQMLVGMVAAAGLAAPALAAAPPPHAWGNVPNVTLNAPGAPVGWGANGWQGAPGAVPPLAQPGAVPPPGLRPAPGMGMAPPSGPGGPGMMPPPRQGGSGPGGYHAGGYGFGRGGGYGHAGGYAAPRRGYRLPGAFLAPGYFVNDWYSFGLGAPGFGNNWVRYYDGAALVDGAGTVLDYRDSVDWGPGYGGGDFAAGFDRGYAEGFDDGVDYAEDAVTYRGHWRRGRSAPYAYATPAFPGYGYHGAQGYSYGAGYGAGGAQVYSAGGATVVVVQGAPAFTTTTTAVEETVSYAGVRRHVAARRAPVRRWRPQPRCVCVWR